MNNGKIIADCSIKKILTDRELLEADVAWSKRFNCRDSKGIIGISFVFPTALVTDQKFYEYYLHIKILRRIK
jgi:hypothetical protein